MKNFIYALMTDRRKGIVYAPFKAVLLMASGVYGLAIAVRRLLYRADIFHADKVPLKVISVGNITLGGTGKTPFVIMLSRMLKNKFRKETSILIRGYGWDEAAMLKRDLREFPVLVGENRARSAHRAIKLYGSDTVVLDDGFQHWELKRDLDIVLVNVRNPFGNGKLFPRGILREPKRALERADVIVLTKSDTEQAEVQALTDEIRAINGRAVIVEARHRPKCLYELKSKKALSMDAIKDKRVILLSSIADPRSFKETVKHAGAQIVNHLIFQDHHDYTSKDMRNIASICSTKTFDYIVTTEKDAVKLGRLGLTIGQQQAVVFGIELEITKGLEAFIDRLHSLFAR